MSLEIEVQRKLTSAFIATSPSSVTLTPRKRTKTPSGGWKFSNETPRSPQLMKVIESSQGSPLPAPVATLDGIERRVEFELLGEWNAVIENYDTFSLGGHTWEVVQVAYFNGWEQRALVSRFG